MGVPLPQDACVEGRGQLAGAGSLLPPSVPWIESRSSGLAVDTFTTELSKCPCCLFFSEIGSHYVVETDLKFVVLLPEAPESEATMSACNFHFMGREMDGGSPEK